MLLTGPSGLGKRAFAESMAAFLLCEAPVNESGLHAACGQCESCHWLKGGNHPDFRRLGPGTDDEENADETEGEMVFTGMLNPGESKNVPRTGALFIEASAAENLQIEINGKRHSLGQLLGNGYQRGQLPAP
jgi:DNA polymerase III delta prime subunit